MTRPLNRTLMKAGLVTAVLVQLLVLGGLAGYSQYPLWVGEEVRVATLPVDPRDWFRGQYVRLDYPFSRLPIPDMELPRGGDPVFVPLHREDGLWRPGRARLREPDDGPYLRGRITAVRGGRMHVRYGIEAWFAPPEEARRLEAELRDGGVARLRVAPGGRAALEAVERGADPAP
ncbi:GDYXXLXY domain-containing protein [Alloalcanivorax profundimaris]|uniref:GDYXXLXY domain-containing protein n=1 Tax=Alloalcanivorax profundimaris TaxID=2735259 RepID=UPI001888A9D2|nr:GDYXXLXY domain-containing protein [Alloalcanivorax profundimaris]MBF1801278.1 GDYXXLXY domain-containing protein [Alloalcanivorax profundimaris]